MNRLRRIEQFFDRVGIEENRLEEVGWLSEQIKMQHESTHGTHPDLNYRPEEVISFFLYSNGYVFALEPCLTFIIHVLFVLRLSTSSDTVLLCLGSNNFCHFCRPQRAFSKFPPLPTCTQRYVIVRTTLILFLTADIMYSRLIIQLKM